MKSVQIRRIFWSVFSRIRTTKNFVFGHFSRSARASFDSWLVEEEGDLNFSVCYGVKTLTSDRLLSKAILVCSLGAEAVSKLITPLLRNI